MLELPRIKLGLSIKVITKLPNSEQSYKGKVKTHNYITDKISQQPENCENKIKLELPRIKMVFARIKLNYQE